jgi:hypothetical protein
MQACSPSANPQNQTVGTDLINLASRIADIQEKKMAAVKFLLIIYMNH